MQHLEVGCAVRPI